jgi:hypothetical protein
MGNRYRLGKLSFVSSNAFFLCLVTQAWILQATYFHMRDFYSLFYVDLHKHSIYQLALHASILTPLFYKEFIGKRR